MKRKNIVWCESEFYVIEVNDLHRKLEFVVMNFCVPYKVHNCLTNRTTIRLRIGSP